MNVSRNIKIIICTYRFIKFTCINLRFFINLTLFYKYNNYKKIRLFYKSNIILKVLQTLCEFSLNYDFIFLVFFNIIYAIKVP